MKLKKHGKALVDFVTAYTDGKIKRWEFDLDYSAYVIEHFPYFEKETPRLAARFAGTLEEAYSSCSWMSDDAFAEKISDALNEFFGTAQMADID